MLTQQADIDPEDSEPEASQLRLMKRPIQKCIEHRTAGHAISGIEPSTLMSPVLGTAAGGHIGDEPLDPNELSLGGKDASTLFPDPYRLSGSIHDPI